MFDYTWHDHSQQQRNLSFQVPAKSLFNSFRKYRPYQPERANRELRHQLTQYARQQGWSNIEIVLQQRERVLEIQQRNDRGGGARLREMKSKRDEFFADYLAENYYNKLTDSLGRTGVKPDHVAIAKASEDIVKPLARAFQQNLGDNTQREYLARILSFMQSMPYEELTDRLTSNGAGFNPPARLLLENSGDCDSKTTLMGSLLQQIMPDVPVYIVYVPNHALLAVRMTRRNDERTASIDGQDLLLVEPTGPARLAIGELAPSTARYIDSRQYSAERFN